MLKKEIKYHYDDLSIMPSVTTKVKSRSECNPFYIDTSDKFDPIIQTAQFLPLFTAPMDSVVNKDNADLYLEHHINPIIPRTESLDTRLSFSRKGYWVAYSLSEFEEVFCNFDISNPEDSIKFTKWYNCSFINTYALIDVANGHMEQIYDLVKKAKKIAKDLNYKLIVMVGNIANPETYYTAALAGVDYIRCSIGTGSACLTATQTSIYYPIASLIDEIHQIKQHILNDLRYTQLEEKDICIPKIVADGGIRGYADIIKALALGADYVMIGSVFTKMWESAAPIINDSKHAIEKALKDEILTEEKKRQLLREGIILQKEYWGMSTKRSQALIKEGDKYKTSEGTKKVLNVEYTIQQWVENFIDYLKSAMSYTNTTSLKSFIGGPDLVIMSPQTKQSITK